MRCCEEGSDNPTPITLRCERSEPAKLVIGDLDNKVSKSARADFGGATARACAAMWQAMKLEKEATSKQPLSLIQLKAGTVARAYAPCGFYWRDNFVSPSAVYINNDDLIISFCHFDIRAHSGDYYSEFDEPTVEELRLMAALILPIGWNNGMVMLYPYQASLALDERTNLSEPGLAGRIADLLRRQLSSEKISFWRDGPPPKAFGGVSYAYRDERSPSWLQHRIYDAIDVHDYLLMRGLGSLIKGLMLWQHRAFGDHALYALFIALEASHQLVLRRLRQQGVTDPVSTDAARLIEGVFGAEPSGARYFEEFYADRIKAFHPESRFGVYPYLPLCNSDFASLFYALREVYRWLILNERVLSADITD
jgi:hypothetical protein